MRTRPFFAKHNDPLRISSPRASQMSSQLTIRDTLFRLRAPLENVLHCFKLVESFLLLHCSKYFLFLLDAFSFYSSQYILGGKYKEWTISKNQADLF